MSLLSAFTHKTTALTSLDQPERTFLNPKQGGGRVRAVPFYHLFTTAAGDDDTNDVVALGLVPNGAQPLGLFVQNGDFPAGAVLDFGFHQLDATAIDADLLAVDLDVATAAGKNYFLVDPTANPITVPAVFTVTVSTGFTADANSWVQGFVLYVENS